MRSFKFLVIILGFLNQLIYSQTVVWSEDFSNGGIHWTLNADGSSIISGSTPIDANPGNQWVVNPTYSGGPFYITIPPSPGGGGNYLHITSNDPAFVGLVSWGFANYGCLYFSNYNTNKVAYLTNPIPGSNLTASDYKLRFEWICQGKLDTSYAKLVYSINGGAWQEYSPQFSENASWKLDSVYLSALGWSPGQSFQFGFRWRNENAGTDPAFGVDNIQLIQMGSLQTNSITTLPISPIAFCVGNNILVKFQSSGTFQSGNVYSLEMSDANGNFSSPTVIGTKSSISNNDSILGVIPLNTPTGSGYRFRVTSSNPNVTGSDNGQNILIRGLIQPDVTISASSNYACVGQNITFQATVTGSGNANISYQWFIDTLPAGMNSPSFSSNNLQPGNAVRVIITATDSCNSVNDTSNVIILQGLMVSCSTNMDSIFITASGLSPYTFVIHDYGDGTSDSLMNVSNNTVVFVHQYPSSGTYHVQFSVMDSTGCMVMDSCIVNYTTTSTSYLNFNSTFEVYPIPFEEALNIRWNQNPLSDYTLKLMDLHGKIVFKSSYLKEQANILIQTNDLPKGVYILEVSNSSKIYIQKIVK